MTDAKGIDTNLETQLLFMKLVSQSYWAPLTLCFGGLLFDFFLIIPPTNLHSWPHIAHTLTHLPSRMLF